MLEERYNKAMDRIVLPPDRLDAIIAVLDEPETTPGSERTRRPLRTVLLAAAICLALAATSLAVSPSLREALLGALGSFAPYSRKVEGLSVVDQGIELKVVSTLCDGSSARLYLELRDLTGDRLDEFTQCDLDVIPAHWGEEGDWSAIGGGDGDLLRYDPDSKTILASADVLGYGPPAEKLTLKLRMTKVQPGGARDDAPATPPIRGDWSLTVEAEMVERLSIDMLPSQTVIAGVTARTLHLSVLGATLESDANGTPNGLGYPLTVYLSDGRTLPPIQDPPTTLPSSFSDDTVSRWTFPEPVEPGKVAAVAIGQWYVPIENGMAQPGHWLVEQP